MSLKATVKASISPTVGITTPPLTPAGTSRADLKLSYSRDYADGLVASQAKQVWTHSASLLANAGTPVALELNTMSSEKDANGAGFVVTRLKSIMFKEVSGNANANVLITPTASTGLAALFGTGSLADLITAGAALTLGAGGCVLIDCPNATGIIVSSGAKGITLATVTGADAAVVQIECLVAPVS